MCLRHTWPALRDEEAKRREEWISDRNDKNAVIMCQLDNKIDMPNTSVTRQKICSIRCNNDWEFISKLYLHLLCVCVCVARGDIEDRTVFLARVHRDSSRCIIPFHFKCRFDYRLVCARWWAHGARATLNRNLRFVSSWSQLESKRDLTPLHFVFKITN